MKFSYRLKRVCGNVYSNGNIQFSPDGNSILSPVGNRVTVFDLLHQTCSTLPFETRKNIRVIAVSNNGRFLITIDVEGQALFINLPRQVILTRFNFKHKIRDVKFAPNDEYFAVTFRHGFQVWQTPNIKREFSPLTLKRTIAGQYDDTVCLDWSTDSESIIIGSKDLSARIYYRVVSKYMSSSVLSGHRDQLIGTFFSQDNNSAYSIARDGAIFTWKFEKNDRIVISTSNSTHKDIDINSDDDNVEDSESEDLSDSENNKNNEVEIVKTKRGSKWYLAEREFLWDPNTQVTSVSFNKSSGLLVVGFNQGVFGLYEMPGCVNLHRLSISTHSINAACINHTGEWLALGSSRLGQLLVWEWQSETYVLKQQGHLYGLNALDFSPDGQYIATGGEDSKLKLWNASSGFCFTTFSEHIAPVTGVKFVGKGLGKAVISCSLDGTVRAHDLLRFKNFRTLTTPSPVQFTCLAVDSSGEVVCAGAMDPFNIYVWSLQTGHLLDVLSGHEGPIACLDFSLGTSMLSSGSWDGTLKIWDVYKNNCVETMEHGCDVLAVAFRPDGKEVCTATTNGYLTFWDVETGTQLSSIEGRRDISGGRLTTDAMTADNAARSKYFTSVVYTADGNFILAGGRSKYTCIYVVSSGVLIKKSLEGIVDELRSDGLVDGVAVDNIRGDDSDDEQNEYSNLPGGSGRNSKMTDGSRTTRPEVITSAIRFSPTGREWAAASTQGLQIFSLDDAMLFAPTDLDIAITPQAVTEAIKREEFTLAINMALFLAEKYVIKQSVDAVPIDAIELVVKTIDSRMLKDLLKFLAEELSSSPHLEYYLRWSWELIKEHGKVMQTVMSPLQYMESIRAIIRVVSMHEKEIMRMSDENSFTLAFLKSQIVQVEDNNENNDSNSNKISNSNSYVDNSNKGKEINVLDGSIFNDEIAQNIESESIIDILNISMTSSVDANDNDDNNLNDVSVMEEMDEDNNNNNNYNLDNISSDTKSNKSEKKKKKDKKKNKKDIKSVVTEDFEIDDNTTDNSNIDYNNNSYIAEEDIDQGNEIVMDIINEEAWSLDEFQFSGEDNNPKTTTASTPKVKRRVSFSDTLVREKIIHKNLPVICDGNINLINQYKNSNKNNKRRNSSPHKRSRRSGF